MTPSELRDWLETSDSQDSGWSKDNSGKVEEDGEGHESVGHESGRKIVRPTSLLLIEEIVEAQGADLGKVTSRSRFSRRIRKGMRRIIQRRIWLICEKVRLVLVYSQ